MSLTAVQLDAVFGPESTGVSPEQRASSSKIRFVRSQDHLALATEKATGHELTASEALTAFGFNKLLEAIDLGTAILPISAEEPASTFRRQRDRLGVSVEDVARAAQLDVGTVQSAEDPGRRSSIQDLERIAQALGLDERGISIRPLDQNAESLAVRLKALGAESSFLKAPHVLRLSEAAWVISTQARLVAQLNRESEQLGLFDHNDVYGDADYPTWEHGYYLAVKARELLGLSADKPIESIRDLVSQLRIPLIQAKLPLGVAGATIGTGRRRGIVVNTAGPNSNVWVRRATVAHELGHLLWDPESRLERVRVDEYGALNGKLVHDPKNIEARANAFALAFLAPVNAVETLFKVEGSDATAVRAVMERFGISVTAAKFHIWNACGRHFDEPEIGWVRSDPTEDWRSREAYTEDYFPLETSQLRSGEFAGWVVAAERKGIISANTAASYLQATPSDYAASAGAIASLYPEIAT